MRSSKAALNAPKSRMQHLLVCARLEYQNAYPSTHGRDEDVKARIDNPTCDFLMKTKASRNQVEIFFKALRAQHTLLFYTKCDAQGGLYVARLQAVRPISHCTQRGAVACATLSRSWTVIRSHWRLVLESDKKVLASAG